MSSPTKCDYGLRMGPPVERQIGTGYGAPSCKEVLSSYPREKASKPDL